MCFLSWASVHSDCRLPWLPMERAFFHFIARSRTTCLANMPPACSRSSPKWFTITWLGWSRLGHTAPSYTGIRTSHGRHTSALACNCVRSRGKAENNNAYAPCALPREWRKKKFPSSSMESEETLSSIPPNDLFSPGGVSRFDSSRVQSAVARIQTPPRDVVIPEFKSNRRAQSANYSRAMSSKAIFPQQARKQPETPRSRYSDNYPGTFSPKASLRPSSPTRRHNPHPSQVRELFCDRFSSCAFSRLFPF